MGQVHVRYPVIHTWLDIDGDIFLLFFFGRLLWRRPECDDCFFRLLPPWQESQRLQLCHGKSLLVSTSMSDYAFVCWLWLRFCRQSSQQPLWRSSDCSASENWLRRAIVVSSGSYMYVWRSASNLQVVVGFLSTLYYPSTTWWQTWYKWDILECGVKYMWYKVIDNANKSQQSLCCCCGFSMHITEDTSPLVCVNFPIQPHSSSVMRAFEQPALLCSNTGSALYEVWSD